MKVPGMGVLASAVATHRTQEQHIGQLSTLGRQDLRGVPEPGTPNRCQTSSRGEQIMSRAHLRICRWRGCELGRKPVEPGSRESSPASMLMPGNVYEVVLSYWARTTTESPCMGHSGVMSSATPGPGRCQSSLGHSRVTHGPLWGLPFRWHDGPFGRGGEGGLDTWIDGVNLRLQGP